MHLYLRRTEDMEASCGKVIHSVKFSNNPKRVKILLRNLLSISIIKTFLATMFVGSDTLPSMPDWALKSPNFTFLYHWFTSVWPISMIRYAVVWGNQYSNSPTIPAPNVSSFFLSTSKSRLDSEYTGSSSAASNTYKRYRVNSTTG